MPDIAAPAVPRLAKRRKSRRIELKFVINKVTLKGNRAGLASLFYISYGRTRINRDERLPPAESCCRPRPLPLLPRRRAPSLPAIVRLPHDSSSLRKPSRNQMSPDIRSALHPAAETANNCSSQSPEAHPASPATPGH